MKLLITLLFFIIFTIGTARSKSIIPSSFTASFEETIKKASTGKEQKYSGKFDYKYSGNIRREITAPADFAQVFVSNASKSWLYNPPFDPKEKGTVTIMKSSSLPIAKVFDSIDDSKVFTKKYEGNSLILNFNADMQKQTGMKLVTLQSQKDAKTITTLKEVDVIVLETMEGNKTSIRLFDLKEGVAFEPDHFNFKVPENTRITTN